MPLAAHTRLGPYEIVALIGSGGMGEVYRARDTRLGRDVAIKVLPQSFASDRDRLRRFEQEARAAGQLNHPNIVAIFDIGSSDGSPYIVQELLEGGTLRERLAESAIPVRKSADYALQITRGLAAAHRHGIVHRGLKPENLFVTRDGHVKILDFGLAKLVKSEPFSPGIDSATLTVETNAGIVLGTAGYMAPEQVRGHPSDARADIFSFGAVYFEMLTGQRAFRGESLVETMSAILKEDPALPSGSNFNLAPAAQRIVSRCLEKKPEERFQSAADLGFAIESLVNPSGAAPPLPPVHRKFPWKAAGLALTCFVAGALLAHLAGRPSGEQSKSPPTFTQLTDQPGPELFPSLAPDGKSFVYAAKTSGKWDIFLQRVGGKKTTHLTNDSEDDDTQPAFSPDGERIAFRSSRGGGGIFVMGATGESVRRVTDFGYNPAWSPDGKELVFGSENTERPEIRQSATAELWIVNLATGQKRQLKTLGDGAQPHWSPHGKRIAYWAVPGGGQRDIWTVGADGSAPRQVTDDPALDWNPVWSPDGKYLYFSSDRGGSMNLWRVPVQEDSGEALGPPEPVTTPSSDSAHMSFSRDGKRLAYVQRTATANLYRIAFEPDTEKIVGRPVPITQGSRQVLSPDLSPDGTWLAHSTSGRQEDIYLIRTDGTGLRQLTDDLARDRIPRWSPDGKLIAFFSNRSGAFNIWTIHPDGSGLRQITNFSRITTNYSVWSPDGARMAFTKQGINSYIIELSKPNAVESAQALPWQGEGYPTVTSWSPDGRRLAGFLSVNATRAGVFIYPLGSKELESVTNYGGDPKWLSDNRRLMFHHNGKLYLADSVTKKAHEVLSVEPYEIPIRSLTLSPDNKTIFLSIATTEADVWMAKLD